MLTYTTFLEIKVVLKQIFCVLLFQANIIIKNICIPPLIAALYTLPPFQVIFPLWYPL